MNRVRWFTYQSCLVFCIDCSLWSSVGWSGCFTTGALVQFGIVFRHQLANEINVVEVGFNVAATYQRNSKPEGLRPTDLTSNMLDFGKGF